MFHKVYLDGEGMKTHLEDFESQTWDGRSLKELNPHILDANNYGKMINNIIQWETNAYF